jgi:hypothetical protein
MFECCCSDVWGRSTAAERNGKEQWCCRESNLDGVVLEEGVIQGRLFGDMHAVYGVSIWTLLS